MESHLVEIAQNLGYLEDGTYFTGEACFESLQEIQNFLNNSENSLDRLLVFFKTNIAESDIIPLLCSHPDDENLYYSILQLIFTITLPIQDKIIDSEISKSSYHLYIQIIDFQNAFKDKFSDSCAFYVLKSYLVQFIQAKNDDLSLDSSEYMELILSIFHNIFYETSLTRDIALSMQKFQCVYDKLLKQLKESGCLDIFLYLTNNHSQSLWAYQVLEILYDIFHHLDPVALADVSVSNSINNVASQTLQKLIKKEENEKINKVKQFSSRHPDFGGTVVKSESNGSEFTCVVTNAENYNKEGCLQNGKKMMKKTSKHIKTINLVNFRTIPASISQYLNEFCAKFTTLSFNNFHLYIKSFRIDSSNSNTVCHYLWYIWFFLSFNRHFSNKIELIGCVLTVETFSTVYHLTVEFLENMKKDSKGRHRWVANLNFCILFYHEFFQYLKTMELSQDTSLNHSESILLANIFYVEEYKDVFLNIFKSYPKEFYILDLIRNLVSCFDIFFQKLYSYYNRKGAFIVKRKRRNRDNSIKKIKTGGSWSKIENHIRKCFDDSINTEVAKFTVNHDSDISIEDQLSAAKQNIKQLLHRRKFKDALLLYRSLCDFIGRNSETIEDDLLDLKKIFELKFDYLDEIPFSDGNDEEEEQNIQSENGNSVSSDDLDSQSGYVENKFNFKEYIQKYSSTSISRIYCHVLQNYKENCQHINACIERFIKYICVDINTPYVFFHISYFRVFNELINSNNSLYVDLKNIAMLISREFFKTVNRCGKEVICSILFWKPLSHQTNIFLDVSLPRVKDISPIHSNKLSLASNIVKDSIDLNAYSEEFNANLYDNHKEEDDKHLIVVSDEDTKSYPNGNVESVNTAKLEIPKLPVELLPNKENIDETLIVKTLAEKTECLLNQQPTCDTLMKQVTESTENILEKGYQKIVDWIINCLENEEETRYMLFLKDSEPLELIPDPEDTTILTQQLFINYFNLLGFKTPKNEFEDPFWKLLPGDHSQLTAILKQCVNKLK